MRTKKKTPDENVTLWRLNKKKKKVLEKLFSSFSAKPLQRDSENLWEKKFRSNPKEKRRNSSSFFFSLFWSFFWFKVLQVKIDSLAVDFLFEFIVWTLILRWIHLMMIRLEKIVDVLVWFDYSTICFHIFQEISSILEPKKKDLHFWFFYLLRTLILLDLESWIISINNLRESWFFFPAYSRNLITWQASL